MFKRHLGCLLALAMAMTACGGGGGGGSGGQDSSYRLSFTPGTLTASYAQGMPQPLTVTATLDRAVSQTLNAVIVDNAGVIDPNVQLSPGTGNSYQAVVTPKASLALGEHTGSLQIKLCLDSAVVCNSQLSGSPFTLPYKFSVTTPPAANVSPARVTVDANQDEVPNLQLAITLPTGTAFVEFTDKANVFQFSGGAVTVSGAGLTRALKLSPTLAPGSYSGQIELKVCKVSPCTQELPGSPVVVPYTITLKSSVNITTLSRTTGVGEWAQHQGNAAHTGYVPLTLDATKFTRRWRWGLPSQTSGSQPSEGDALHPVVTANDSIYVVSSGRFQVAALYAVSEHDGSQRWKKDFGSVYAANPPSTDAGGVFLATSGHGDTAMWGFDAATGTQKFRTAFGSQWEHYLAPTIIGGNVYTNGGSYGGLLSFKTSTGTLNWFAYMNQYDMWTPAVDGNFAYAFMPNGLNAVKVADGSQAFVISDPNSAVQAYSVNGAPMQIGPNNVVVINGSGFGSNSNNRLVNFDIAGRNIKWSVEGKFTGVPAFAKGVVYAINGAQLEARSETDGSRLWAWLPDETSTDPFRVDYGQTANNVIVTDNLAFVSTVTKVYAVNLATRQTVWTFSKPGRLALSPNGVLYVSTPAVGSLSAGVYAINLR